MKFRHFTTMETDFDAEKCLQRLGASIDPENRTVFSLSGYVGSKPVIGWTDGYQFYLHKRRYWYNSFAPLFYGNFLVVELGTVIEGYFDLTPGTKKFMRIFLGLVILFTAPFFAVSLIEMIERHSYLDNELRFDLLWSLGFALFAILMPKIGLLVGLNEERFILEFLQNALRARLKNPKPLAD